MKTLSKIGTVRAKATITPELSLLSKLDEVTSPEFGRGATADGNPERCQGLEDNLHSEVSSDSLHAKDEMPTAS